MNIAIRGGGPGGLYSAILFSRLGHEVTVWERNAPDDTFGFGVVFSDETLVAFEAADPPTYAEITRSFARWGEIDIYCRGELRTSGGHGFSALSRKHLLNILQKRAADLGAELHFLTESPALDELAAEYDLVICADGVNSQSRAERADVFGPSIDTRKSKFMWLGTDLVFEAFTFHIVETEWGVFQLHCYPYDETMSTFIVETDEATWRRAGLDASEALDLAPGESDERSIDFCRELFADVLDGHELIANNSKWLNFNTVRNEHWHDGNVVLLGDAAHTAHFSIGSGTKLAMEDAIALAWAFKTAGPSDTADEVLQVYEDERRAGVASTQRAAQASLEWFEEISRYIGQDVDEFAFNLLTRSRRITYENLRMRDGEFMDAVDRAFALTRGHTDGDPAAADVLPVSASRPGARQPGGRLADGHVRGAGRLGRRLPPCPSRQPGHRRRRPGDDRDGVRLCRGPDHARLRRPLPRRSHPRLAAHRRVRPCPRPRSDRLPDRPQRSQGRHEAAVGGRPRADGGPVGPDRAVAAALLLPRVPMPREMDRAAMDEVRDQFVAAARRADAAALTCSRSTWPTATCCPRSSRRSPTGAPTRMAGISPSGRASRSRSSTRAARYGRRPSRCQRGSRPPTGLRAASPATTRWRSRGCSPTTAATSSTSRPARCGPTSSRPTGAAIRRHSPTASATRSSIATMAVGAISSARGRQHDHPLRPRRPLRPRPPAPLRPVLDAARCRRPGVRRALDRQLPVGCTAP